MLIDRANDRRQALDRRLRLFVIALSTLPLLRERNHSLVHLLFIPL